MTRRTPAFYRAGGRFALAMADVGFDATGNVINDVTKLARGLQTTRMCFVAGTPIHTIDGLVPIEQIDEGDLVWSRDEYTGAWGYRPVTHTVTTRPDAIYHVSYDPDGSGPRSVETLSTTAPHPFWVADFDKFIPASELVAGHELVLADGSSAWVTGVSVEQAAPGQNFTTYNFGVAEFATYFAGASGVWVHNEGDGLCEVVHSIYFDIKRRHNLDGDPWEAFKELLTVTEPNKFKYDAALGKATDEVMRDAYATAMATNPPDLSKIPTVAEAAAELNIGVGQLSRMTQIGYQNHHTVPKYVQRLFVELDFVNPDSVPSLLMPQVDHVGAANPNGRGSFHSILYEYLPKELIRGEKTTAQILDGISRAYNDFGRPDVWAAVEEWLSQHGVVVP